MCGSWSRPHSRAAGPSSLFRKQESLCLWRKPAGNGRMDAIQLDVLPEELHRRPFEEVADARRPAMLLDGLRHLVADEVEARVIVAAEARAIRVLPRHASGAKI